MFSDGVSVRDRRRVRRYLERHGADVFKNVVRYREFIIAKLRDNKYVDKARDLVNAAIEAVQALSTASPEPAFVSTTATATTPSARRSTPSREPYFFNRPQQHRQRQTRRS